MRNNLDYYMKYMYQAIRGNTQIDDKFEYSCQRTGDNNDQLITRGTACISDDGTRLAPGSGVEGTYGYFIVTCDYNKDTKLMVMKFIGCIDDNGYRIELDEEFVRDGRRYRCNVA
uniref:Abnormal cell migration protein 18-like fibronectin type I domain-containing protein n=1 Tax=Romanomermis culicivorax TaxID=13658 RepID=A0A915JIL4_ROMCU